MTVINYTVVTPDDGKTVTLPSDIHKKAVKRDDTYRHLTAIGGADEQEYVLLSDDSGVTDLPDGAEVFGVDPRTQRLWYAMPRSAYGGGR